MFKPEYFILFSLFLPFLYAETHYRFKYFFSWLKKPEPEIIADIPSRLQIGKPLPVLLIVKDSHIYDVELLEIQILLNDENCFFQEINQQLIQPYFDTIFFIDTNNFSIGHQNIDVKIKYKVNNKIKFCTNDNHRGTKHQPLPIYISKTDLPKFDNCIFGETHSHTNYTSDQLEFGASVKSSAILAESMGLQYYCTTDHSYDLDDDEGNYLVNDPGIPKWKKLLKDIAEENFRNRKFQIISGEEASLRNHKNRNIHCLIYNSEKFYPGNGDSGEKWLYPYSELAINDVLNDVDNNALVFAAHPVEPVQFLQKLLIRRDNWYAQDCHNPRLNGLQFANGGPLKYFEKGKILWIKLLLAGYQLTGIAGNDAHGNFSKYRQVSFPFFKMQENYFHLFGVWRTGVYLESAEVKTESIINSIKFGNCFLTNGPALQFEAFSGNKKYAMGSKCDSIEKLSIRFKSTLEFGKIISIIVYKGIVGNKEESIVLKRNFTKTIFKHQETIEISENSFSGYFRCEVKTVFNKVAVSNPIWYK